MPYTYGVFTIAPIRRVHSANDKYRVRRTRTGNDIDHVSMIQRRRHVALFLVLDERLEQPDGSAMNVAGDEADAHVGCLSIFLQLENEPVSFLLVRLGGPMVVLQL